LRIADAEMNHTVITIRVGRSNGNSPDGLDKKL
jgi:hypothetical protein